MTEGESTSPGKGYRIAPRVATTHLALGVSIVAATVAFVAVAVASLRQSGPTVHPDEWGFLTNGQVLLGHHEAVMPTTSFYPVGFGIFTAVGAFITGSFQGAYKFTLVLNLLLALTTALVCARMARRIFGVSRNASWIAGILVFVMPGTLLSATYAWPEMAVRLAFLLLVLLLHRAVDSPEMKSVAVLAVYTGFLPLLHGRFILVMPIIGLSILWMSLRRLVNMWNVVAAAVLMGGAYAVSTLTNSWAKHLLYPNSFNQQNRLLRRLVKPDLWSTLMRLAAGQTWYLLATTAGLFGVGLVAAVLRTRRDNPDGIASGRNHDIFYWTLLASIAAIIFTASLQLIGFNRGDHLIYGRYAEVLVPLLVILAVSALDRFSRPVTKVWLASLMVAPAIVAVYLAVDGKDVLAEKANAGAIVYPNIPGIDAMHYLVDIRFVSLAGAFLAFGLFVWLCAYRSRIASLVVLIVLFASGIVLSAKRSVAPRSGFLESITQAPEILRRDAAQSVAFDSGIANDPAYYFVRYKIHPVRLVYVKASSEGEQIPADISCVFEPTGVRPPQGDWESVAEDGAVAQVLWRRVGTSRC